MKPVPPAFVVWCLLKHGNSLTLHGVFFVLVGCIIVSTVVNSLRWNMFKTLSILLTGKSDKVPFQVMKYKSVAVATSVHLLGSF